MKYNIQVLWQYTTKVDEWKLSFCKSLREKRECELQHLRSKLETFTMDNSRARFVVFLFRDPHLLEGGERGQDGTTDPNGVLSFWWSDDLDFDGWWCECSNFLLHTISNTLNKKYYVNSQKQCNNFLINIIFWCSFQHNNDFLPMNAKYNLQIHVFIENL